MNPQPLPPGDDDRIAAEPTGAPSAGGNFGDGEAALPRDASTPPLSDASPGLDGSSPDASVDAGDASVDGGDASVDGGDASPDATRD
ncbi:MAG: hypothetical protein IPQ09_16250 [Myxococcales bacterium]|nr:hypothetical protein [Myxococcales bacterium]